MAFKWKEEYSCDIKDIDEQHKKLFEIGYRLYYMASLKDGYDHYDAILEILEELKDYTRVHFDFEEKLMIENNYSDYDSQKIEHDFFIKKIQRIERKDLEEQQGETIAETIAFVADWITSHILKSDMKYKSFFKEKGIN